MVAVVAEVAVLLLMVIPIVARIGYHGISVDNESTEQNKYQ